MTTEHSKPVESGERGAFERWAKSPEVQLNVERHPDHPSAYKDYTTSWAFAAWKAATLLAADDKADGEVVAHYTGGRFIRYIHAPAGSSVTYDEDRATVHTLPQPQAERPAERVALTDEMDAEELALFKSTVDDFDDCGETSTPDATLMDWARRGYLDCVRFETTEKAHKILAALPDDSGITGKDQS